MRTAQYVFRTFHGIFHEHVMRDNTLIPFSTATTAARATRCSPASWPTCRRSICPATTARTRGQGNALRRRHARLRAGQLARPHQAAGFFQAERMTFTSLAKQTLDRTKSPRYRRFPPTNLLPPATRRTCHNAMKRDSRPSDHETDHNAIHAPRCHGDCDGSQPSPLGQYRRLPSHPLTTLGGGD